MRFRYSSVALGVALAMSMPAMADDSVIKLGQTIPYSGPASSYGVMGRTAVGYFQMLNENGGINGRKVELISLDDAFSPPKTVERTRRLVERDGVSAMFGSLGSSTNNAVGRYLNDREIPHLFLATGAANWSNPEEFPYSTPYQPSYVTEGLVVGKYVLENVEAPKIAILYQNDNSGKDYREGLLEALGDRFGELVVSDLSYNVTDVNVDNQIISGQASGANVLIMQAVPKFAAQAISKSHDIGWKAERFIGAVANTIAGTLAPAGLDKSTGVMSVFFLIDAGDPDNQGREDVKEYKEFMAKYVPEVDPDEGWAVYGYVNVQLMAEVLRLAGDDLSSANIMKHARNFELNPKMILDGIPAKMSVEQGIHAPISGMRMGRFDGERWVLFGDVIDVSPAKSN